MVVSPLSQDGRDWGVVHSFTFTLSWNLCVSTSSSSSSSSSSSAFSLAASTTQPITSLDKVVALG